MRYVEHMSPLEAVLDERAHVKAVQLQARRTATIVELPGAHGVRRRRARARTSSTRRSTRAPSSSTSAKQFFQAHAATVDATASVVARRPSSRREGFFTSYLKDGKTVSFYGDNHPHYAGSVVKAMASAKDGYPHVVALFPEIAGARRRVAARSATPTLARALREARRRARRDASHEVNRLTPTIVEVVVHAPMAARKFQPGQFYRLQNFETLAPVVDGTRLAMEGLALTGAWVDAEKGLLGTIVLEMGGSSRLCAALAPGEPIVLMGPTGHADRDRRARRRCCSAAAASATRCSSRSRAPSRRWAARVLYFAGYQRGEDLFKRDDIERYTDQVIWCTDTGAPIDAAPAAGPRTSAATSCRRWSRTPTGELGGPPAIPLREVNAHHRHRQRRHDGRRPRGAARRARAAPRPAPPRASAASTRRCSA